jgi:hypothetical protein
MSAALESLDDLDINRTWETIPQVINISAEEFLGYYEFYYVEQVMI